VPRESAHRIFHGSLQKTCIFYDTVGIVSIDNETVGIVRRIADERSAFTFPRQDRSCEGAGSGSGLAIARQFLREGASIVAEYINPEEAGHLLDIEPLMSVRLDQLIQGRSWNTVCAVAT
jgi:hypothetical protein